MKEAVPVDKDLAVALYLKGCPSADPEFVPNPKQKTRPGEDCKAVARLLGDLYSGVETAHLYDSSRSKLPPSNPNYDSHTQASPSLFHRKRSFLSGSDAGEMESSLESFPRDATLSEEERKTALHYYRKACAEECIYSCYRVNALQKHQQQP